MARAFLLAVTRRGGVAHGRLASGRGIRAATAWLRARSLDVNPEARRSCGKRIDDRPDRNRPLAQRWLRSVFKRSAARRNVSNFLQKAKRVRDRPSVRS